MRHITLQTLTWGTVAAAVGSALWLAAAEPGGPDARRYNKPTGGALRPATTPSRQVEGPRAGAPTADRGVAVHRLPR